MRMLKWTPSVTPLFLLAAVSLIAGCDAPIDDPVTIQTVTVEPFDSSSKCPDGGVMIRAGEDIDGSGDIFGDDEVTQETELCNGADGTPGSDGVRGEQGEQGAAGADGADGAAGADGADGADGAAGANGFDSLINLVGEPPGINCVAGGQRVDIGLDNGDGGAMARDGVLEFVEVDSSAFVCNGEDGEDGADGAGAFGALLESSTLSLGSACAQGGTQIDMGLDNGDGGGTANNLILDAGEIDEAPTLYNGADGADGADGTNGTNGTDGVDAFLFFFFS